MVTLGARLRLRAARRAAARIEDRDLASIDALPGDLGAVTAEVVTADFGVCSMAPVLAILGDEPATRAAFAGVWP